MAAQHSNPNVQSSSSSSSVVAASSSSNDDSNNKSQQSLLMLSWEQLRDIRDQLRTPLTGRRVLIPAGRQAFFAGTLQPTGSSSSSSGADEKVLVRTTNTVPNQQPKQQQQQQSAATDPDATATKVEMTRTEALDYLQQEMDALISKKKPLASALKKSKSAPSTASSNNHNNRSNNSTEVLKYFEIREEIDTTGKEIRSEAIDVSRHLEYLRSNPDLVDADTLPPPCPPTATTAAAAAAAGPWEELPVQDKPLVPLSDTEYDALAARLEELAKREEMYDEEKEANTASSKKLQSKGWSKGFFNKTPKKGATPKQTNSKVDEGKQVSFENDEMGSSLQQDTNFVDQQRTYQPSPPVIRPFDSTVFSGIVQERSSKTKAEQKTGSNVNNNNDDDDDKKPSKVSFTATEDFQVREIPKIGQTPVAAIRKPVQQSTARQPSDEQQQQQQPKRMSRFAMQRQQLLD